MQSHIHCVSWLSEARCCCCCCCCCMHSDSSVHLDMQKVWPINLCIAWHQKPQPFQSLGQSPFRPNHTPFPPPLALLLPLFTLLCPPRLKQAGLPRPSRVFMVSAINGLGVREMIKTLRTDMGFRADLWVVGAQNGE